MEKAVTMTIDGDEESLCARLASRGWGAGERR
jgi:hypothetical protein